MHDEQAKLDRVLSNPDPWLLESLRRDEKRRRRITLVILGGLIMFAIVSTLTITFVFSGAALTSPNAAKSNAVAAEGWQLWQKQQFSEALDKFQQAVKLNPGNANAWNGLGWVYFNSGTADEAEKAWQKTLKLQPGHPAALNGLGQLALTRRQYDKAEQFLLPAANQNASAAWWGLTRLYLLQGKFDQAEKWARKIVAEDPENADAARMLEAAKARDLDPALRSQIEPPPPAAIEAPATGTAPAASTPQAERPADPSGLLTDSLESGEGTAPVGWKRGAAIDGVTYLWDRSVGCDGKASLSIKKTAERYFPIAEWSRTVDHDGSAATLTLSAMVKAQKATKAILDVQFLGPNGSSDWTHKWAAYIGAKNPGDPPATHDWMPYSGKVDIPAGTKQIIIGLQMYGPGQVWFDNVKAACTR